MIAQVQKDENNQNIAVPISGSIPTGLPVGTWISFEKDQAPDNKWIKAGETFDENLYPALYLFLGTNKVPERFDHSRLSELEQVVAYTTTTQSVTAQYDGFFIVTNASSVVRYIQINGQDKMRYSGNNALDTITFSVKKGDVLTISGQSSVTAFEVYASYYKHPMFIKATSAIEITDQNTFLNTVKDYVDALKPDVYYWYSAVASATIPNIDDYDMIELQLGYSNDAFTGSFTLIRNPSETTVDLDIDETQNSFKSRFNWTTGAITRVSQNLTIKYAVCYKKGIFKSITKMN